MSRPRAIAAEVEARAADEQGDAVARGQVGEDRPGMVSEVRDRERRVGIDEVQPVVRDARPLGSRDLGRADVEATEDLPRIGRDDLRGPTVSATSASARRIASSVLPVAVAPATTMRAGRRSRPGRGSGVDSGRGRGRVVRDGRATERIRAGVVDADE